MMRRLLIANRGEITRRIARTCRRMGIEYVVVYSEADAGAAYLDDAAAAVCLGGAPSAESYLNIDRIIGAARDTGCDAVHPGYGFLSENAGFARAVAEAGLVFVGPRSETIAAMGDKSTAKSIMAKAGVPVVPGSTDASDDPQRIVALAREIGLPVLLKPAAGGGGKGMTVVDDPAGMQAAVEAGIRVARTSFGDGRILVERYVSRPRHIEVQVFGDRHGNVVHLFERECSLQRRHQKIVEEAPAPNLADSVRQALLQAAVQGARAIGYQNAGTFEFILGPEDRLYFLEVNTRLQVEHPVTEEITGLDLVEWQLRVAAGEPLPLQQDAIRAHGHAIECRVYAEDAAAGFRPAPGRVLKAVWPENVRVESAIVDGSVIPPHYDPMVAKLVTRGNNREAALAAARRALGETQLFGLTTNVDFLLRLLCDEQVAAGRIDTHYVDDIRQRLVASDADDTAVACAAAMAMRAAPAADALGSPWLGGEIGGLDRVHLDPQAPMGRVSVRIADRRRDARLLTRRGGSVQVEVDGENGARRLLVSARPEVGGLWSGRAADRTWSALVLPDATELVIEGRRVRVDTAAETEAVAAGGALVATAPMPGVVVALRATAGEFVSKGQVLLVVEAMKMENPVLAPVSGIVAEVKVAEGTLVAANQVLMLLKAESEPAATRVA
ncbi:MAG: ATP-grasp domain-containing protein [Hyphomicrobiaceae bacterium]|nr:ATP-grasp domain-containing protein [Hyphomicrobiaceae bacterium]